MNRPKAYIVRMSVKNMDIRIDEDEIDKVLRGISTGSIIKVRQGIINPSFFAGITEDVERVNAYEQELRDILANNDQYKQLNIGEPKKARSFQKLQDVFADTPLAERYQKLLN